MQCWQPQLQGLSLESWKAYLWYDPDIKGNRWDAAAVEMIDLVKERSVVVCRMR